MAAVEMAKAAVSARDTEAAGIFPMLLGYLRHIPLYGAYGTMQG